MATGYRRILLKLSGEGLAGDDGFGIHPGLIADIADQVREVHELGTEICIVIGGGTGAPSRCAVILESSTP